MNFTLIEVQFSPTETPLKDVLVSFLFFSFQNLALTLQRIVECLNMSFEEARNSLVISFAEGSISEEEFLIFIPGIRISESSLSLLGI